MYCRVSSRWLHLYLRDRELYRLLGSTAAVQFLLVQLGQGYYLTCLGLPHTRLHQRSPHPNNLQGGWEGWGSLTE
jgi:hypothetical protein